LPNDNDDPYTVKNKKDGTIYGYIYLGAAVLFQIPANILLYSGKYTIREAINKYNDANDSKKLSYTTLKFGLTPSGGVGFTLNF